jgi:hypothetical protein
MIYLTYNDQPSAIYFSQVTDVCNYVSKTFFIRIKLIAFVSFRNFFQHRKSIRLHHPNSLVLPMFPKNKNWKWNIPTLRLVLFLNRGKTIWCRGIFATNIALGCKNKNNKIIFDARGAYKAEFEEYLNKIVVIKESITELEQQALEKADLRLAVSQELVNYWKKHYHYQSDKQVVIPCTLGNDFLQPIPSKEKLIQLKGQLGFGFNDVIFVYSGSAADWQSIHLLDEYLLPLFERNKDYKLILLSKANIENLNLYKLYSNRVMQKWLAPKEVKNYLFVSDYGLLIREDSITNQVASPTKFAEYLSCGLKVIISERIGDFSSFVKQHNCGFLAKELFLNMNLEQVNYIQKQELNKLALTYFKKDNFKQSYLQLISEK